MSQPPRANLKPGRKKHVPASFKPARQLTCPHGRFWRSCERCQLQRETGERTVALIGASLQRSPDEALP